MNLAEAKAALRDFNARQKSNKPYNPEFHMSDVGWPNSVTENVATRLTCAVSQYRKLNKYLLQLTPSERDVYALRMIARGVIGKKTEWGTSLDDPAIDWEQINRRLQPHHRMIYNR